MLFVGLIGDANEKILRCAVVDAQHAGQVLAEAESAPPPELSSALDQALRGGCAALADLARLHALAGAWIGSLARSTLQSAGLSAQPVELAGSTGIRLAPGLALGDLAEAARASNLLFVAVSPETVSTAAGCALAAREAWLNARQAQPEIREVQSLTEARNPATLEIDRLPTLEMLRLINLEDARVPRAVASQLPHIAEAVDRIAERMRRGGRLIYTGAGTSGRLGVLDASEIPPTYGTPQELVVALIAGGDVAVRSSLEGVEDDAHAAALSIQDLSVGPEDSLVAIAASGRTPYAIGAMEEARRRGALVISVACNSPSPMEALADVVIAPLVGPEVITGSTRMKAGTAQKLVLNMLSTGVMVRLGKTYSNLMVDMQATNIKLRGRARRIVALAAAIEEQAAGELLDAAGGEVKTAIVMAKTGAAPGQARTFLERSGGVVRAALELPGEPPAGAKP